MTFDEWFEREFGPRPFGVTAESARRQLADAEKAVTEARQLWRLCENWEAQEDAARRTWGKPIKWRTP